MPVMPNRIDKLRVLVGASLVFLAPCCLTAQADTLHVPGEYGTIQAAINAAVDGDTVLVADGIYTGEGNTDLDFDGKAITVRSENGPENCIIDCEEREPTGFYFRSGETTASIAEGFTITKARRGGVRCKSANPTIINCIITENVEVPYHGGAGVRCEQANPTITNCRIIQNRGGPGAGVYCTESSPTITDCEIAANVGDIGGGICCIDSSPTITNCEIAGNVAGTGGGILCFLSSSPIIANCTFTRNVAGGDGRGGAVYCRVDSNPALSNCTITHNVANHWGGGVWCGEGTVTIVNCILWGNQAAHGSEIALMYWAGPATAVVSHSDVQGGEAAVFVDQDCTLDWGDGNIEVDPLLARPAVHLQADSPCIDAGDPEGNYTGQTDIDGEPRVVNDRIDIGADEFLDIDVDDLPDWWESFYFGSPSAGNPSADDDNDGRSNLEEYALGTNPLRIPLTYYVTPGGDDAWDGLAPVWDGEHGPKATIQGAIDATQVYEGDTVIVAEGMYTGEGNRDIDFAGKAITVRGVDPNDAAVVTATIIDCEGSHDEPHRGFSFRSFEGLDSVLAGLTVRGGYVRNDNGGAILCKYSSPMITNCVISDSTVADMGAGGGIHCFCHSSPAITNCKITGNTANGDDWIEGGGGICCSYDSSPTIARCEITRNVTHMNGGGICCCSSSPMIVQCAIQGNWAHESGGIHSEEGHPTIACCAITNNVATWAAGISCCDSYSDPSPIIADCLVTANTGGANDSAVYCAHSDATIANCVLWGNSPQEVKASYCNPVLTYCDVRGGWAGEGNIDADPLFVDPDGPDDDPNTWEDNDYRLSTGSPCIDAGNNTAVPADVLDLDGDGDTAERTPLDLDDHARFADDPLTEDTGVADPPDYPKVVDMGAYEFRFGDLDRDGVVGGTDLLTLLENYGAASGMTYADGDLNGDGDVDLSDLAWLLAVYGEP